jgi:hypothetical protein
MVILLKDKLTGWVIITVKFNPTFALLVNIHINWQVRVLWVGDHVLGSQVVVGLCLLVKAALVVF